MKYNKIPIIGVMGSGSQSHEKLAIPLGRWIAESGFHLLTGAGGGVMASVSKSFCSVVNRKGKCIGIIPGKITNKKYSPADGYPNQWIEIPIFTHLYLSGIYGKDPMSRNHINILSSDVIVALPGAAGTVSEIELAVYYNKPLICFGNRNDFDFKTELSLKFSTQLKQVTEFIIQALSL